MRTRFIFAILASAAIAGCSGASGRAPGSSNNPVGSQATKQEQAQAATEAAFAPIESGNLEVGLYNGSMGATLSSTRAPQSAFAAMSSGSCNNSIEFTKTVISSTQTQYETKYFFDKSCTYLARDVVALVTQNSSSSESVVRTATSYNLSGLVLSTRKANFAITGAPGNFSAVVTSDLFIGTSSSPAVEFGRQFTIAPHSSNVSTISANSGKVVNVAIPRIDESFGHMGVLSNGTMTIDGSNNITFAGSHAGTFIKGPYGSLTLSAGPPFTVTGGTTLGTTNVSGSVEFDPLGNIVSVSITGTLWNGGGISVSSSGMPPTVAINGTITDPSHNPLATFSVDQYGDGVITYSDGTQALIIDWHVIK
jgi:hypothetical protein